MQARKLDMKVEADNHLARDFFSAKDGQGTAMGLPIRNAFWHK